MVTSVGLPLLIVKGKFQSLGSMSVEDLETFIPYLAKCSINRAGAQVVNGVPEWWPSTIQFKFPLKKPIGLSQIGYKRHLSSIVCRCYWYHKAQYVLPFCAAIANHPDSVYLKTNEDNTTSIFYSKNTAHIMKFNNENTNYDKQPKKPEKVQRRCLLSALPKKATTIPDIYLCENCDAEFSSHSEMVVHEKTCYQLAVCESENGVVCGGGEKNEDHEDSSEEVEILEHFKPGDSVSEKINFFEYLCLSQSGSKNNSSVPRSKKCSPELNSRRRLLEEANYYKNRKIEFSSLYGRKMIGSRVNYDLRSKIQKSLIINEAYCCASVRPSRESRDCFSTEFKVTGSRKTRRRKWTHEYCFNKRQRRSRYITLKTGLDERSRKLLKQCKELRVVLHRLKLNS